MTTENTKKIRELLVKVGLDQKESQAYLYCLLNGPQHVSQIGRGCGFTRTNAYDVVKKLEEKGLCYNLGSLYGRKIKIHPPQHLKSLLFQKKEEMNILEKELEKSIPLFHKLEAYSPPVPTEVSYFRGKEGLKQLIGMTLQSEGIIKNAGSELDVLKALGEEFVINYHQTRVNQKIKIQALRPGIKRGEHEIFHSDTKHYREVRVRKEDVIRLKSVLYMWNDTVAFCSFDDEIFGTLIENKKLVIMLSSWFDFVWDHSSKI